MFFSPKKELKTKEQKQEEIIFDYTIKMQKTLQSLKDNKDEYKKQKLLLLKTFAKELEFNIFFDKDEVREIIKALASKDFKD